MEPGFELKSVLNLFYHRKNFPKAGTFAFQTAVLVWENNRVWKDEKSNVKDNETILKSPESLSSLNTPKIFLPWSENMALLSYSE